MKNYVKITIKGILMAYNEIKVLKSYVRTNSFLEYREINLSDLEKGINEITFLPADSVLMNIDLQIIEAGNGNAQVGIKGDSNKFLSNIDLATIKDNQSSIRLHTKKAEIIVIDLNSKPTKGKAIFRLFFFGNQHRYLDHVV